MNMRYQGKLTRWNDEKGYGFITPHEGGKDVFVHISSFAKGQRRPVGEEMVTYEVASDERQRACATNVMFSGRSVAFAGAPRGTAMAAAAALLFFTFIGASVVFRLLPVAVLIIYVVVSCLAFAFYGFDKSAAKNDRWRIPESRLHMLGLLGGWPGALVAQRLFRHKSRKPSFQLLFWIVVMLNCAILGWLFSTSGSSTLRTQLTTARMQTFRF
jgi:uncharacterized membrane protein YsdA (DUF1294 family)/cold shock CspA family protein